MNKEKIYWRRLHLETDPETKDLILWDAYVNDKGEEHWNKVEWSVIDQHYAFRHFVQQRNMFSNLAKKANVDGDGNLRQQMEEMDKALKSAIEEINESQDIRRKYDELKNELRESNKLKDIFRNKIIKLLEENQESELKLQQWDRIKGMSLEQVMEIVSAIVVN